MIKNVIFDLDGTLIDSSGDVFKCMKKAFRKAGVPFHVRSVRPFMGPPLPGMVRLISPKLDDEKVDLIAGYFRSYYDNISYKGTKLFKGARTLLRRLSRRKIRMFIATNKRMEPSKKILKVQGVYGLFDGIFSFDMNKGSRMGKVEMIGHLLGTHGLNNRNTILAGDNESDIIAAKKNGLISVAVLGGYGNAKDLRRKKPSYMIGNIGDMHDLVMKINRLKGR